MAQSKLHLNNINIGSVKLGTSDVSIYLGENKVYPLAFKLQTMINGQKSLSIGCTSGNTTISSAETHPSTAYTLCTSAALGECVDTIGEGAFSGYTSMTGVTIPNTIISIGNYAFQSCLYLSDYSIPSGVTSIGSNAFNSCEHITSITIPDSVTSIGSYAFYSCNRATSLSIGSGLTSIGDNVFYNCTGLTSVNIPDTITSIGDGAFQYCRGLNSINIGNGVTTIGYYAFNTCSSATSISIGSGVTTIKNEAFAGCTALTSITIDATTPPTLGSNVFYNTNDCPIYVPCESVNTYKAASGWSSYASRIQAIPNSCPKFYAKYSGGETYDLACDGNTTLNTTNTKPTGYEYSAMTEAIIGDCVTSIGGRILWGCISLSSITIPDSVTSIGTYAFYDCSSLTSIEIPSGVTSITNGLFESCSSLSSVDLPSGVTSIGDGAFYECSGLTSIVIPDSVTSIGSQSFSYCSSLSSVDLPSGVTSIGNSAFQYCSGLTSVTVNAIVPPTLGGATVFNNTNNCPIYVPCESVNTYKAASGWSDYASRITCLNPTFQGKWKATYTGGTTSSADCDASSAITRGEIAITDLVSVEIGDCVTSIGYGAFGGCSSLTNINIPSGVTSIGDTAFDSCYSLTSIDIPSGVTSIGDNAFHICTGLTSVVIPNSVTSIGNNAFGDCSSLTSVTIGSGVTSIGIGVFLSCASLSSVTIEATVPPTLGGGAFDNTNDCPIYVPCESVNTYKAASGWSDYASRITCLNPPTYKYGVNIQGLEGKDTCDIDWKNIKMDYSVGNGSYTITTTADTVYVIINNFDYTNYSVDYEYFTLTSNNPDKIVTFTYQGGGLTFIPQGTDMTQYYNRTITRFKIGDPSFPNGYQQLNIAFGGQQGQIAQWVTNFTFSGTLVTSLPCDVSGSDSLTQWDCFDSSWGYSSNNPFTDLWIEFA